MVIGALLSVLANAPTLPLDVRIRVAMFAAWLDSKRKAKD